MIKILIPLILIGICIGIYLHYFPPIPKQKKQYEYALLLGCPAHNDGSLCTSAKKRCTVAIDEYDKGHYKTLVITGGAVKNQYIESETMKTYILGRREIPTQTETKSKNTWENFLYAKEITHDKSVLIITSGTHARRACAIASHFFYDYSAAWYPEHRLKHIFREIVSRLLYIKIEMQKKKNR